MNALSRGLLILTLLTSAVLLTGCGGRLRPGQGGANDAAGEPTFTVVAPPAATSASELPTAAVEPTATVLAATTLPQPTATVAPTTAPTNTPAPTLTAPAADTSGDALDDFLTGLGNAADDPTILTELEQIP